MMKFLSFEVPFEKSGLKSISKLYFIVFDHRTLVLWALKVFISADSTVMFASTHFIPFNTDPQFFLVRFASMQKWSKVPGNTTAIIEEYLPTDEIMLMIEIIDFESF
jgi:hypothetical protein